MTRKTKLLTQFINFMSSKIGMPNNDPIHIINNDPIHVNTKKNKSRKKKNKNHRVKSRKGSRFPYRVFPGGLNIQRKLKVSDFTIGSEWILMTLKQDPNVDLKVRVKSVEPDESSVTFIIIGQYDDTTGYSNESQGEMFEIAIPDTIERGLFKLKKIDNTNRPMLPESENV